MSGAAVGIATLGLVGRWPLGPGTLASVLVTLFWRLPRWPWAAWLAFVLIVAVLGTWASDRAERVLGHDDSRIVIDEVLGMAIVLLAAPRTWAAAVAALALFRIFDIGKPPPLGWLQRARGGWGVMLDDAGAGVVAAAIVLAVSRFL